MISDYLWVPETLRAVPGAALAQPLPILFCSSALTSACLDSQPLWSLSLLTLSCRVSQSDGDEEATRHKMRGMRPYGLDSQEPSGSSPNSLACYKTPASLFSQSLYRFLLLPVCPVSFCYCAFCSVPWPLVVPDSMQSSLPDFLPGQLSVSLQTVSKITFSGRPCLSPRLASHPLGLWASPLVTGMLVMIRCPPVTLDREAMMKGCRSVLLPSVSLELAQSQAHR